MLRELLISEDSDNLHALEHAAHLLSCCCALRNGMLRFQVVQMGCYGTQAVEVLMAVDVTVAKESYKPPV
jgi:hypothetical protein